MLVQRGPEDGRSVQSDGRRIILVLSQQLMASQMVFGQLDEIRSWSRGTCGKDLRMYIVAQLLYSDVIVSGVRRAREGVVFVAGSRGAGIDNVTRIVSSEDGGRSKCIRLS